MRAEPWAKSMNEIHLGAGWFRVFSHHIARVCEFVCVCVCVSVVSFVVCDALRLCFFFLSFRSVTISSFKLDGSATAIGECKSY